ncbi:MAG: ABC transporter permease [Dethiobacteria bacterium]|jgi:oligopeptide transport system permease protein|nr:ABC transporter permease [Bacillota bacterium]NMD32583.1 ABC transporter permease [Bacillota bacterium]HOB28787.1 ABC transporter permease [Bacillota bacterium]HPZ41739.1 ABC transporter permease [Bacillota bacterium]HQD52536.1 ABC transporter permease [Bacillota bacterium]
MLNYLSRRMLYAIVALLVVVTVTFIFMHAIPGGPFQREKALPEAVKKNIEARYKLDQPLYIQYIDYLSHLVKGDLGPSYKYRGLTVNDIIEERFPVSVQLGSVAILIALLLGIPAGILAALHQNSIPDYVVMFFSTIGIAMPSFVIGTLLMYFLSYKWGLLPSAMWGSPQHIIMPAIALAGMPTAFIARLTRSSMLEVLSQDYMKTAVAKGLPQRRILWVHGIKNAIIPVVTYLGPLVASVLTGSFVVENIFAVPGLGKHFVTSINNRDYTVILGVTIFYCVLLILANLLVDLIYPLLDPRIQLSDRKEQV